MTQVRSLYFTIWVVPKTGALVVLVLCAFSALGSPAKNTPSVANSALSQPNTPVGSYADLLKPLDIYAPPPKAKKLVTIKELYAMVQSRGVVLKVSRETFNAARQSLKAAKDNQRPVLNLDLAHDQKWTKTMGDSDSTDDVADRRSESTARSLDASGGLSLSGNPAKGVSYRLAFPQLAHAQSFPGISANPPRPDNAAFSASVELSLLRDAPFIFESLERKKDNLTMASAREAFRRDTIKSILEAEGIFYQLVQKFLQLSVQERSLNLARALQNEVKDKIAAGESSPLEATRAELQAAQAETDFMSSQIDYESAVESFRSSLALDDKDGDGVFPDPRALDVAVEAFKVPDNAFEQIQTGNSEIAISRIERQLAENAAETARKSTLPSLGFSMNYGNSSPGNGIGQTTMQALRPNDRVFGVGLKYTHILYNDSSKNSLQQATVAQQKAAFATAEVERRIQKEFNALIKKLDIGGRRHRIARISREIAEKKLNSEYEKFRAGESSVRNVIDSQTEVNGARISEIGARIEMLVGYGQLRMLRGQLPDGLEMKY